MQSEHGDAAFQDTSVSFQGTQEELAVFLADYYEKSNPAFAGQFLVIFQDAMNQEETLKYMVEPEGSGHREMGLVLMHGEYYLNTRLATIALIGLILDATFTHGFAAFVIGIFGLGAEKIRKLKYAEKRVLMYIQAEKISWDPDAEEYVIHEDPGYEFSPDELKKIIEQLIYDEVILKRGNDLGISYLNRIEA